MKEKIKQSWRFWLLILNTIALICLTLLIFSMPARKIDNSALLVIAEDNKIFREVVVPLLRLNVEDGRLLPLSPQ